MLLSTLDRYLVREIVGHWFAVLLILWAVLLVNRLVRYLGDAAAGELAAGLVLSLIGLKTVAYLVELAPLALFLGILLALGRLYRDHEMAAAAACGLGPRQFYRPLVWIVVVTVPLLAWLALLVQPRTDALEHQLVQRAAQTAETEGLIPGRFQALRGGELVIHTESADRASGTLRQVFAELRRDGELIMISAARGRVEETPEGRYVVLESGHRYQGRPGDEGYRVMQFARHSLRLAAPQTRATSLPLEAWPSLELLARGDGPAWAQLLARVNTPLAALMLSFIALPLAVIPPRKGRYHNLLPGVLVAIIYFNLMQTGQAWVQAGSLTPLAGLAFAHALPAALGLGLLWWRSRLPLPASGGR